MPPECGLLEVHPVQGDQLEFEALPRWQQVAFRLKEKVDAPFRDTAPANWAFVASICRRLTKGG